MSCPELQSFGAIPKDGGENRRS
jgi:hypothetical protein